MQNEVNYIIIMNVCVMYIAFLTKYVSLFNVYVHNLLRLYMTDVRLL